MAVLETVLKSKLEETSVASLLATTTSIWMVLAPQGAAKPLVTYEVIGDNPHEAMSSSVAPTTGLVQVSIFAETALEINNIFIAIRAKLNRIRETVDGVVVQDCFYESRADRFSREDNLYQRDLTFRIFYEE